MTKLLSFFLYLIESTYVWRFLYLKETIFVFDQVIREATSDGFAHGLAKCEAITGGFTPYHTKCEATTGGFALGMVWWMILENPEKNDLD